MNLFLEHDEFVRRYRANEIRCIVNKSTAMQVCDNVPAAGGCAHQTTKAIGCVLPLAGLVMFFFTDWWKALLCIIVGAVWCSAVQRTAGQNVVELTLKDAAFYERMLANNILRVEER